MTQLLHELSKSIALLVATAAPRLTAVRTGANRHVTGLLWGGDLVVTCDQALPATGSYTIVLSIGAFVSALPGPRDPLNNLASLRLGVPVPAIVPEPARGATIGALVLVLGADFDGSPTVRLTAIHGFRRAPQGAAAVITLDLAGERVSHGGMALDAEGRLLGMTSVSPSGDAVIVVPHGAIARFVEAATAWAAPDLGAPEPGVPNPVMPDPVMPDPVMPDLVMPDLVMPDLVMPDPVMPDPVMPDPDPGAQMPQTMASPAVQPAPIEPAVRNGQAGGDADRRGWLGVSLQPITVPDGLALRAGQRTARQVVRIARGGPADRAGLRSGDVLLALDGSSTSGNQAFRTFLAPERIGSEVEVRLMRDGLIHTTVLTIAAQPDQR
jgi:S1-C subfamily serine protease